MVLWETVLSPFLQVLFDKLASGKISQLLRRNNLDDSLLEELKIAYFANVAMFEDAEKKQYDSPAVQTWLDMLKEAIYEAEDLLDELATEASLHAHMARPLSNHVLSLASNLSPFCEGVNSKIKKLISRLEYIAKHKDFLGLKSSSREELPRRPTTPLLIDSQVYGRASEKDDVVKKLLMGNAEGSSNTLLVVPIVGMGGVGKTTLARMVYNDSRVEDAFDAKAWVYVSEDFDLIRITKSILESATRKPCDMANNLECLQTSLRELLTSKRFLVVFDDVWNERIEDWENLLVPLMAGSPGSRIIATARNKEVCSIMNNAFPPFFLSEMSDEACWSLFENTVFKQGQLVSDTGLLEIGREIVKKCKGLPLVVKTLASALSSNLDEDHWREVLNSRLWHISPSKNDVLPSLRLSYHHLPTNLKRCFSYCSIFPKGYEFDKKKLVLLWMAEGFVQPTANTTLEKVGERYFSELQSRSFFQETKKDDETIYVMHDLLNDLAQSISRRTCLHLEEDWNEGLQENFENLRHFSCFRSKYDVYTKFESLSEAKRLRTFLPLPLPSRDEFCYLTKRVPHDLIPQLKCLRVLSFNGYCINEIPESIGGLKHLRYIDLSYTEIKNLPSSLTNLFNLQTLLLCSCDRLTSLPDEMWKLVNLRYLDISGCGIQDEFPNLGNLKNLQMLPQFIVSKMDTLQMLPELTVGTSGSRIGDLRNLVNLKGSLCISQLQNVSSSWDARRSNLQEKRGLNQLVLEWSTNSDNLLDENGVGQVLEMLQPNPNLEKMGIKNFPGKNFPTWIMDSTSLSQLVSVTLSGCKRCTVLPPLGQFRLLKKLTVERMPGIRSIGAEFYGCGVDFHFLFGPFPSLEKLSFTEMPEWEQWSSYNNNETDFEVFPSLVELCLEQCPKLRGNLPPVISSLTGLMIRECQNLSSLLPRLPKLQETELKVCCNTMLLNATDMNFLTSMELYDVKDLINLPENLLCLAKLERLVVSNCFKLTQLAGNRKGMENLTSLRHLIIRNCSSMISFCDEHQKLPQNLENLELESCHKLEVLPFEFHNLGSLQELVVTDCPQLESFPRTAFPRNLKGLVLRGCGFESLPEYIVNNTSSLDYIYISGCLFLTSFPRDNKEIPTTFKQLTLDRCPDLEYLPQGMMHPNNVYLELLEIFESSITSFPNGQLPRTLKTLTIWLCPNLESLADIIVIAETTSLQSFRIGDCAKLKHLPSDLHKLVRLDYLEVDGCPSIESFPEEGLPNLSLTKMHILNCENLKFLTKNMRGLVSLEQLRLHNCPVIENFPYDGFPVNLVSLDIKDCWNMKPCTEWGLHRLTSLKKLGIHGCCINTDSLPEWLFPSNIETLHIGKQTELKSLSPWLGNLTSLGELKIRQCQNIASLPVEGLPKMVSFLEIRDCPLLWEKYENDMSAIDHIPCIIM